MVSCLSEAMKKNSWKGCPLSEISPSFAPPPRAKQFSPTIVTFAVMSVFLVGCAGTIHQRAQGLQLDMPREQVIKTIGHQHSTVAARKERDDQNVEVLRFSDKRGDEIIGYFRNGKLVQWGDLSVLRDMPE